ncbi:adhesion G-protein coupled receptor G1 isoform X2 [Oreochromis niloticus]|uniref:adhesion G-protein coupled receptor G1 isoform X2 n=1 Tax=Oreochromis niloticus TaxID=8128 RepID=UPI000904655C|nr:adhesion G-protein coupled receptor G1 isoform X2 [Oreochromis niloticus]
MWITLFLFKIICFSMSQAAGGNSFTTQKPLRCGDVLLHCTQSSLSWTRCYEEKIAKCELKTRIFGFSRQTVNSLLEGDLNPTSHHRVYITSSSFEGAATTVMASVINSTYFKLSPPQRSRLQFHRREGTVLRGLVLAVKAVNMTENGEIIRNLLQPIMLFFKHNNMNPEISVTNLDAEKLSYITYIGSALSVIFTFISLIIFIWLHRRSPEKAIGLHMQLTGAMFCLHLSFLLCSFWEWLRKNEDSSICLVLGLFLHWSLLATLTWTALEGFQIYLLLIRVFNIYIRRYLLKLCLVGWGFPTFVATICGISGVYGKYTLQLREAKNGNSTAQMCWISSDFQSRRPLVSYITTVAFPLLVVLFNACMLGLVVCKMWKLRSDDKKMNFGSSSDWKEIKKEKRKRLWKDCLTVLGLSCVLGLPWGLASTTYVSLTGIYIFTILNSLQGVFIFLWSVGLARKS